MARRDILLPLLLSLLLLWGCAPVTPGVRPGDPMPQTPAVTKTEPAASAEPETVEFTDDLGRKLSVEKPRRVAAMIGSFADVWCLAGGKDTLVATANDAWTSFDLGLGEDVTNLGGVKEPNLERLLTAQPDFVLASCNTAANLELEEPLKQAGIPTAYFDVQNFSDYLRMLEVCAKLTGDPDSFRRYGLDLAEQIEGTLSRPDGTQPSVLCIRATGVSCKVKGSRENVLGEMLADLKCRNVADREESLLDNLSLEAIMAADPDYIFAVLQGSDDADARRTLENTLLNNPAWESLRAVREGRFYTLPHSLYNLKPNARWGEAYEKLADILYPEA